MKVSELGRRTTSTEPYGSFTKSKQDKQGYETFTTKGKKFPDSQDLMGGPIPLQYRSKEEKAAYAKERIGKIAGGLIESGKLWSEGRYHQ